MKALKKIGIIASFIFPLYMLQGCDTPSYLSVGVHYSNPSWAPPYYNGVRYYYLPDIETYYDLSDQEFIYLDRGQWLFSPMLPSIYGGYDLYNGFVIALNFNVYQPWMHHQFYVSHYPRFYYRNVYGGVNISTIRGFNENVHKPIYWRQEDRNRLDDLRRNEKIERRTENIRQPQPPGYYGRRIGQPVKVQPQMRENKPRKRKG